MTEQEFTKASIREVERLERLKRAAAAREEARSWIDLLVGSARFDRTVYLRRKDRSK